MVVLDLIFMVLKIVVDFFATWAGDELVGLIEGLFGGETA